MTTRRLLIVTYHFPPSAASGSFRMLGFARHLGKFGWEVVVVAPPRMPEEPVDPGLRAQIPSGTKVLSAAFPRGRVVQAMRRIAPNAVWLPRAWAACRQAIRRHRPDAMLTSSPPHCVHVLGYYLQRRFNLPWIADFRDPWITGANVNKRRYLFDWESRWERRIIERADIVVANAPRAAENLREVFPAQQQKIHAILNGFDPENFDLVPGRHSLNGTLHILHTGEMYCGRDPKPFLDVMQEFHGNGNGEETGRSIRVHFLGRNDMGSPRFRAEIERRGLNHLIETSDQVPYNQAIQAMTRSDILLLFDTPGRRAGVPAKLYEYIGVGRPILALAELDSDVAWVLRESGIPHRLASPSDPMQIKQALAELIDEIRENRSNPPAENQRFLFTRQAMAGRLAEVMNATIHEKKC